MNRFSIFAVSVSICFTEKALAKWIISNMGYSYYYFASFRFGLIVDEKGREKTFAHVKWRIFFWLLFVPQCLNFIICFHFCFYVMRLTTNQKALAYAAIDIRFVAIALRFHEIVSYQVVSWPGPLCIILLMSYWVHKPNYIDQYELFMLSSIH